MIKRIIIFLALNFVALALGSFATKTGANSDWYLELNKAPWTPPGWFFGVAWTTIMICFAIYMAKAYTEIDKTKSLIGLFGIQWVLNVVWNPVFFYFHNITLGLVIISALTIVIGLFVFNYKSTLKTYSLLIVPYFIWILIATSLNAYILINN